MEKEVNGCSSFFLLNKKKSITAYRDPIWIVPTRRDFKEICRFFIVKHKCYFNKSILFPFCTGKCKGSSKVEWVDIKAENRRWSIRIRSEVNGKNIPRNSVWMKLKVECFWPCADYWQRRVKSRFGWLKLFKVDAVSKNAS